MTTARTQQGAPASSVSDKVKETLSGIFAFFAKADPDEVYREKLHSAERTMFDRFQHLQQTLPRHTVFLGITEPCCPDRFESYATVEQARHAVDEMSRHRCGPQVFVALDLKRGFRDQWSKKPDGSDVISVVKAHPISHVPAIALSAPRQDRSFRFSNS